MSAMRSSAVWWDYRRGRFRVRSLYTQRTWKCLIRGRQPRAGVNKRWKTEPETQRNGRGAGVEPGRNRRANRGVLERRDHRRRGTSSKVLRDAKDDAVNKRARKSLEEKDLAPQVGLEPTTLRLTAECSTIELLRSKNDEFLSFNHPGHVCVKLLQPVSSWLGRSPLTSIPVSAASGGPDRSREPGRARTRLPAEHR